MDVICSCSLSQLYSYTVYLSRFTFNIMWPITHIMFWIETQRPWAVEMVRQTPVAYVEFRIIFWVRLNAVSSAVEPAVRYSLS